MPIIYTVYCKDYAQAENYNIMKTKDPTQHKIQQHETKDSTRPPLYVYCLSCHVFWKEWPRINFHSLKALLFNEILNQIRKLNFTSIPLNHICWYALKYNNNDKSGQQCMGCEIELRIHLFLWHEKKLVIGYFNDYCGHFLYISSISKSAQ